jgi:glycosyltransferase involved in cell wall biosynthesis
VRSTMTRFSVCIPNYNYARYLGETLRSVLDQSFTDLEVLVSDNASTDDSVGVVKSIDDERITLTVNRCNVGFAGNLDRAADHSSGDFQIMLSSDDVIYPQALEVYDRLFTAVGDETVVISSTCDLIDYKGRVAGRLGPDPALWNAARTDNELSELVGMPVLSASAPRLLRRCLLGMRNPFNFLATAYSRESYLEVEGYGGGRLINPDKWFHWRLLGVVDRALFVDEPLFGYRWHEQNQLVTQNQESSLKFLVDDYTSTIELPANLLHRTGLTRNDVRAAFVEYDIGRHGLVTLARGHPHHARRILAFGRACYPTLIRRNPKVQALAALSRMGPVGRGIASVAYQLAGQPRMDKSAAVARIT